MTLPLISSSKPVVCPMAAAPMSIQGSGGEHDESGCLGLGAVAKVLCDEVPNEGVMLQ